MGITDKGQVNAQYATAANLNCRISIHAQCATT